MRIEDSEVVRLETLDIEQGLNERRSFLERILTNEQIQNEEPFQQEPAFNFSFQTEMIALTSSPVLPWILSFFAQGGFRNHIRDFSISGF